MISLNIPMEDITEEMLQNLVAVNAVEGRTLDFKEDVYLNDTGDLTKDKKKEFIKDICSFANASGGHIVCGIKADEGGMAGEIVGLGKLGLDDFDDEQLRFSSIALDSIEPRIPGLKMHCVQLSNKEKGIVIVFRVPRSYAAPHRIKSNREFWMRRENNNREMDMDEIRRAFSANENLATQIRDFREKRVAILSAHNSQQLPTLIEDGYRTALHIVPLNFADLSQNVDLSSHEFFNKINYLQRQGLNPVHNLDGLLFRIGDFRNLSNEYFQVFRSGASEYVHTFKFKPRENLKVFMPDSVEYYNMERLRMVMQSHFNLGVEPPLVIMLSVIGIYQHVFDPRDPRWENTIIRRQNVLLPELVIDEYPEDLNDTGLLGKMMRPLFDMVWNIGEMPRSPNYDENGNWRMRN